ncbi:MAG: hypothetical protein B7Z73_18710 [Planctomycetia bacterium 21-64-5]|nr:MAG: hypothetical protein B7Z73_18710 [Planctomycetia bacterium 21-64-5]
MLANAWDPDPGDMGHLTASMVGEPSAGGVAEYIEPNGTIHSPALKDGSFAYFPPLHFYGTATFQFDVSDGIMTSDVYTVTIDVIENPPSDSNMSYSIYHDQVLTVAPSGVLADAFDPDPPDQGHLTASLVSGPNAGTLSDYIDSSGVDHPLLQDGSFVYTPAYHWYGTATFQFDVTDGILTSGPYTVTIDVIENVPTDSDVTYNILHDHVLTVPPPGVLANASDPDPPDQGHLTAVILSQPSQGQLSDYSDPNTLAMHPLLVPTRSRSTSPIKRQSRTMWAPITWPRATRATPRTRLPSRRPAC